MRSERQLFYDAGQSFRNARGILEDGCDFPLSFEGFCHGLKLARDDGDGGRVSVSAEQFARGIVENYHAPNYFGYVVP